jgi:hypothetical protein
MTIVWDDDKSPADLEKALNDQRFGDAEELCKAFLENLEDTKRLVPLKTANKLLAVLRSFAWFDWFYRAAIKMEEYGQSAPKVQRQLAQARIEQGHLTDAIVGLKNLRAELKNKIVEGEEELEFELGEAIGLLGRSYKQLYIDSKPLQGEPRLHDLKQALEHYGHAYKEKIGDYMWHGVNYIALLTHAERIKLGKNTAYSIEAQSCADDIQVDIDNLDKKHLNPWILANRIEAYLAQGKTQEAIAATEDYLNADGLDAFMVQGTRRQLVQLWMLNEEQEPGVSILPMMTARLAELGGGGEVIDLAPSKIKQYEAVFGNTQYQPLQWLLKQVVMDITEN